MTRFTIPPAVSTYVRTNQTTLLMSAGLAGVAVTAGLSWRGGMRAARILDQNPRATTRRERFGLIWKELLLPAGASALTVLSIVGLDKAHTKKIASVAAAYALSEKALSDLKREAHAQLGDEGMKQLEQNVAENVVKTTPIGSDVVTINDRQTLVCETWSRRYFWSSLEAIQKAELKANMALSTGENEYSLTEFYDDLEVPQPDFAYDFGWVAGRPLRLTYGSTLTSDGRQCLTYGFNYVENLNEYRKRR